MRLVGYHGVGIVSGWDDHGGIRVTALDALVVHDVLGVVLPVKMSTLPKDGGLTKLAVCKKRAIFYEPFTYSMLFP